MSKKKIIEKSGRGNRRMEHGYDISKKVQISFPEHIYKAIEKDIATIVKASPIKEGHLTINRYMTELIANRMGIKSGYRPYEELEAIKKIK